MSRENNSTDVILHNGKVLTVDPTDSTHQSIAILGERIQAVGSDGDVLNLAGPDTQIFDLQGLTIIPGIIDIHAHMDREGLKGIFPSLQGACSIDEILAIIKQEVSTKRPGEWVVMMPIGDPPNYVDMPESLKEGHWPTRWQLDQVSPDNPVYIKGIWTPWNVPPSVSIANSMALGLAGIDRDVQSPDPTVIIERNADGEPNGVFIDNNRYPTVEFTLMKVVPRFTHAQRVSALKESMRAYNSVGTTGIYEGHGVAPESLKVYREVWDANEMTVRADLVISPYWDSVSEAEIDIVRWAHSASGQGFGDSMLRTTGIYIQYRGEEFLSRARSAELPYTGWAGFAESYNPPDRFRELAHVAARNGLRVNTLVRGVLDEVLDIFEEVHKEIPIDGKRWVINHVLHTSPEQLEHIQRLGLVVETIPLTELWLRGASFMDDSALADGSVAHRSYIEHGVHFGLGTDNKPYNPFITLWSAIARRERKTGRVIGPTQCLTRMEALRAMTMGGAYFSFEENRRGSLEPGKLADLAVLSKDLLTIDDEEIPELRSLLTMVGGKIVYQIEGQ